MNHVASKSNSISVTTWWETFLGDELDDLCHLWSRVPGDLILAGILAAQPAEPGFARVAIRPRVDLLESAEGSNPLSMGAVHLRWSKDELSLEIAADVPGRFEMPTGRVFAAAVKRGAELSGRICMNGRVQ